MKSETVVYDKNAHPDRLVSRQTLNLLYIASIVLIAFGLVHTISLWHGIEAGSGGLRNDHVLIDGTITPNLLPVVSVPTQQQVHPDSANNKANDNNVNNNSNSNNDSNNGKKKKKIAYAITVTKDGHFVDGALVLGYSALKVHDESKGFKSEYEAELVAFVTPSVQYARPVLQAYGWKVLEKGLPVQLDEIQNKAYADNMKDSGCCGADEFLKLWAYTLTEYHRVVHLDMDSIVYKSMDELYSIDKELLYTGDWNMRGHSPVPPVQGGFLVIRPSMERFEELRAIIRKGDHTGQGWGGSRIGNFWGGQTIQGILPYFYYSIHPTDGLEVNRCIYNCMVDNPYIPKKEGTCLDGKPTCEDCRLQKAENVASAHFTICQKPWTCTEHVNPKNKILCEKLHEKWFVLRDELEKETKVDLSYRNQNSRFKGSLGMCHRYGDSGYKRIPLKDGLTA